MKNKERFFNVYANLPLNLRDEIVLVINEQPISWKVAYLEIEAGTKLGKQILEKLIALKFI
jgi:hypothetical protein